MLVAMLLTSVAVAQGPSPSQMRIIREAAKAHDVEASDLVRIAAVESSLKGRRYTTRVNSNWTIDLGLFQINSVHWDSTCSEYDVFTLKGNAYCAAKLLAQAKRYQAIDKHWKGRYHSKTPSRKVAYNAKLSRALASN